MVMVILSPMLMGDSQGFEYSFKNDEKPNCADEDEWDVSLVRNFTLEGMRQDVDHGIAYDGPTSQCIELVDDNFEAALTETLLKADQ